MANTTLRCIRDCSPCRPSWRRLCRAVGGMRAYGLDTPISLTRVLDVLDLDDAIWACQTLPAADLPRVAEFAARCAQRVEHLRGAACYAASSADRAAAVAEAAEAADAAEAAEAAYATAAAAASAAADAARAAVAAAESAAARAAYVANAEAAERAAQIAIFCAVFA